MARAASRMATISHWTKIHAKPGSCLDTNAPKEGKNFLNELIKRVDGLYAIIICDREGIPILRVISEKLPESALKTNFLAAVGTGFDQATKLGLGKCKHIVSFFANYQVVHLNKTPLSVSLIANTKANTGLILNLESELSNFTDDLKKAISTPA